MKILLNMQIVFPEIHDNIKLVKKIIAFASVDSIIITCYVVVDTIKKNKNKVKSHFNR